VILPACVFDQIRSGAIWVDDLACLTYTLSQLERGEVLSIGARLEGDALVLSRTFDLYAQDHDPEARMEWRNCLDNLARLGWFDVENEGSAIRIRRGPLAVAALTGRTRCPQPSSLSPRLRASASSRWTKRSPTRCSTTNRLYAARSRKRSPTRLPWRQAASAAWRTVAPSV
jgi:hypothetical protein